MRMILTAGALGLALMVVTIGAVHAQKQTTVSDETMTQAVLASE